MCEVWEKVAIPGARLGSVKRILLTGFEAFGAYSTNPTLDFLNSFGGMAVGRARIHTAILPVHATEMPVQLRALLEDLLPDAVLLTGLAARRTQLSLERAALNILDFALPDNAGQQFEDEGVVPGGPAAYLSTLPLRAVLESWRDAGVPGYLHSSALPYLGNQAFYLARHWLGAQMPCGLLHVPANAALALAQPPDGLPMPYLPQTELRRGVEVVLRTLASAWGPVESGPLLPRT